MSNSINTHSPSPPLGGGWEGPLQEQHVSNAFSRQSVVFDSIYDNNPISVWMRDKARAEVMKYLQPGNHILELNCGTGTDTVFFARQGFSVTATDNAEGMLQQLRHKIELHSLQNNVIAKRCSFNNLHQLGATQYNYIFSNFSGLNCAPNLPAVLKDVDALLTPGGYFTFVIMPKVCPWEFFSLFKGRFKLALRRFKKDGATAHIEGVRFTCYYYNASVVKRAMGNAYTLCGLTGLASLVPPPSLNYFPQKYPRLFPFLQKIENKVCNLYPFNTYCDQYIITMRKNTL